MDSQKCICGLQASQSWVCTDSRFIERTKGPLKIFCQSSRAGQSIINTHIYIYIHISHMELCRISSGFPQKDVISQPTSLDSLKDKQRYQRKKLQILQDLLQKALHPFHPFTYAGSFERLTTRPRTKEAWTGWSFSNDGMWLMMDRNVWI